jgi:hypothetical protein
LSIPRRIVADYLHAARHVPATVVQTRMHLAPLVEARTAARQLAAWSAIYARAYGLVAADMPELRRFYMRFPWPHFYELDASVGQIAVERRIGDEPAVLGIILKEPEARTLPEMTRFITDAMASPIERFKDFKRAVSIARLPLPIRRLVIWIGLTFGRQRANYFGTFAVSSVAYLGADIALSWTPCPVLLTYGVATATGEIDVRLVFDHRCFDGATAARALARLQEVLLGPVLAEVRGLSAADVIAS